MTAFPSPPPVLPEERLAAGAARLAARYGGRFSLQTVQGPLDDSCLRLARSARVRTHLVVLAERFAGERLEALAHVEVTPGSGLPRVLFGGLAHHRPRRRTDHRCTGRPRRHPRTPDRPAGHLRGWLKHPPAPTSP